MECKAQRIPYQQTNSFTKIVLDYLNNAEKLKPFYKHNVSLSGIQNAIQEKSLEFTNRKLLTEVLENDYSTVAFSEKVASNISLLKNENTFTVTTAHQSNIFTGPLYFIYKILHVIKLSQYLSESFPDKNFVPVFFMGSEDADLDELGHTYINHDKILWNTNQKGAVGRMKVDKAFIQLIQQMQGQLSVEVFGNEMLDLIKTSYVEEVNIQSATFQFVHKLFGEYGLLILLPDNKKLKAAFKEVMQEDLLNQTASEIVLETSTKLNEYYKVQASPRDINLFYLDENIRNRIEVENNIYKVVDTDLTFTQEEILKKLDENPEKFSPNVILRGLFQEKILPNIAFVGGGGELAYWLQLKDLFSFYQTSFPVLVLRNSFLIIEKKWAERINKLGFESETFFQSAFDLLNNFVLKNSENEITIAKELELIEEQYENLKLKANNVDATLKNHVEALLHQSLKKLSALQKKLLRAEKRKFEDTSRQISTIKNQLFPHGSLQERKENISSFYAKHGKSFVENILQNSLSLEQEFVIIEEM
jgi:bacillithiol biosynthesis cysteine-adding enzyme BshC